LEITPYATARLQLRPQYSDPVHPTPRLVEPSADIGADLRVGLTSDLTLNAAINPDFGQVEADQVVLNLSNQELFFPEKRPFFTQGLELFQPVGAEFNQLGSVPMQLFYSRRVGLETPILAAAKVTGTGWKGLDIGILDAVVMGAPDSGKKDVAYLDDPDPDDAWVHQVEGNPDRRLQFHLQQPLHVGLNSALPREPPVSRNYFAAVARQTFLGHSSVGLTSTSVNPLQPRCTHDDIVRTRDARAGSGGHPGEHGRSIRWDEGPPYLNRLRWLRRVDCRAGLQSPLGDGEWVRSARCWEPPHRRGGEDVLRDGTVMHPETSGAGLLRRREGRGEGRALVNGRYASRSSTSRHRLQQSQNQQSIRALSPTTERGHRRVPRAAGQDLSPALVVDRRPVDPARQLRRLRDLDHPARLPAARLERAARGSSLRRPGDRRYGCHFERIGDCGDGRSSGAPTQPRWCSPGRLRRRVASRGPGGAAHALGTELTLFVGRWLVRDAAHRHYEHNPQGYGTSTASARSGRLRGKGVGDRYRNGSCSRPGPEDLLAHLRQTFVFAPA
jgi:hypothetical protein